MIYTNKKVFFYTKIRFAAKILKITDYDFKTNYIKKLTKKVYFMQ